MNCDEIQALIHAHHDGELDAANTRQVDQHLVDCPRCFALSRNLGTLRILLRDEALRFQAPVDVRAGVQASMAAAKRMKRAAPPPAAMWWRVGLAAAALLALCFTFQFWPARAEDRLLAEMMSSHVRSLMVAHLMDVASSDQHTVKPWFDRKLDFAPPVKDLRESGFPLLGGRLDYLDTRPVAALVYARQKHLINLFVWPANPASQNAKPAAPRPSERNGYHIIQWSSQGMAFGAVSDLNEKELMDFAHLLFAP